MTGPRAGARPRPLDPAEVLVRPLCADDEAAARAAHAELAAEGFHFLLDLRDGEPWAGYLARVEQARQGWEFRDGWVPATFLVAEVDGELAGRISVRHRLNGFLLAFGGHIGYAVRPSFRRRGIASAMLRRGLEVGRAEGVHEVLITCDETNVASARIIERAGGVLENVRTTTEGVLRRRYSIR